MRSPLSIWLFLVTSCHPIPDFPSGGYPYPTHVPDKDTNFYFYPIRDKEPKLDSFRDAWAYQSYRALDEPNLSLNAMPMPTFRLTYSEALNPAPIIISLTPEEIIVKTGKLIDAPLLQPDTNRLTPLERKLVLILDSNYPIEDTIHHSPRRQHRLDSLGKLYPQLYDHAYYFSLWQKEWAHSTPLLTYTTNKIKIKSSDFNRLVSAINASGYWQMPPRFPCTEWGFDGYGYFLEANTPYQYNIVSAGSCSADTSRFAKACQELVRYAGMEKRIQLAWTPAPAATTDSAKKPIVVEDVQLEDVKQERPAKKKRKH